MKKNFNSKEVIFLLVVTCLISLALGNAINIKKELKEDTKDEYLEEFEKNYQFIVENYYDEVDKSKLIKSAIEAMANSLGDDYSVAITDDISNSFNIRLTGSYSGIGIEIVNDQSYNIYISEVFENSPAAEAGLQVMDMVLSIDDLDLKNKKTIELTNYIKEHNKDKYTLKIKRGEEEKTLEIKKKQIELKSVNYEIKTVEDKKIGYIYISVFASNTASQFKQAIEYLENEKINSLIIDVRNNTGGHLTSVVDMLSNLLDSTKVIYQIESKGKTIKYYSKGKTTKTYPIVVLQNNESASASELLSAALKEEYGATIIGENSFGKGTVQELVTLPDGTQYKITTKKWLTPTGNWINGTGVTADIVEKLNDSYNETPMEANDNQLQRAIEYLKQK